MLRNLLSMLANRAGLVIPETVRDDVHLLQVQQLKRNSLILYLIVFVNSVAGTVGNPEASVGHPLMMPTLVLLVFLARYYDWRYRTVDMPSPQEAHRILRGIFVKAVLISIAASIWALASFIAIKDHLHGSIPLFVVLSAYAAATCLSVFPQAAFMVLVIPLVPMSAAMLASGKTNEMTMSVTIILVTALHGWVIARKFGNLVCAVLLQRSMRLLAETDALTSLANRRGFRAVLESATLNAKRNFSVLMLDLDRFKPINDTYGHATGDFLLTEVAMRLRQVFPEAQLVARLGGDEFAVLVDDVLDQIDLQAIRTAMAEPYVIDGVSHSVGASVGCATYPIHGTTAKQLLSRADAGLYACKRGVTMTLVA